ncbi:hypothetical protein BDK51DRAFT_40123 [Blyttiomyces helicus]|uniref:Uncharacterized protein n=1 Tax=Blyttiomyces helicus TaxID=388810 RepID=A0A4V1IQX0_9FUNG|nr:hypothetical protein BDK51DRAFT_40123 [Blyttiomyces helicus]|eukprot:RKO88027.1 hypothetical protein BDK51DRAFT_40123 [Blyttiomyces helicus]
MTRRKKEQFTTDDTLKVMQNISPASLHQHHPHVDEWQTMGKKGRKLKGSDPSPGAAVGTPAGAPKAEGKKVMVPAPTSVAVPTPQPSAAIPSAPTIIPGVIYHGRSTRPISLDRNTPVNTDPQSFLNFNAAQQLLGQAPHFSAARSREKTTSLTNGSQKAAPPRRGQVVPALHLDHQHHLAQNCYLNYALLFRVRPHYGAKLAVRTNDPPFDKVGRRAHPPVPAPMSLGMQHGPDPAKAGMPGGEGGLAPHVAQVQFRKPPTVGDPVFAKTAPLITGPGCDPGPTLSRLLESTTRTGSSTSTRTMKAGLNSRTAMRTSRRAEMTWTWIFRSEYSKHLELVLDAVGEACVGEVDDLMEVVDGIVNDWRGVFMCVVRGMMVEKTSLSIKPSNLPARMVGVHEKHSHLLRM